MDLDRVLRLFPPSEHDRIRTLHEEHGLFAWGAIPGDQNTGRWERMVPGDWVLCVFANRYRFVLRLLAKYNNERFARDIWGVDEANNTWQFMYFLTRPQPVDGPVEELASFLFERYQGFSRIGDQKLAEIERVFGSIDTFIESKLLQEQTTRGETAYFLIRSNVASPWNDVVGDKYRYATSVPNHKKLSAGGRVVVDRKTPEGVRIIGYGELGPAALQEGSEGFEAPFLEWISFDPVVAIPDSLVAEIQSLPNYNVQHAIRPITKQIYEMFTGLKVPGVPSDTRTWIFQGNPEYYDTRGAVRELPELTWLVSRHSGEYKINDSVYLWEAGPSGGIVAKARLTGLPKMRPGSEGSDKFEKDPEKFKGTKLRAVLSIVETYELAIARLVIQKTEGLTGLSILKQRRCTIATKISIFIPKAWISGVKNPMESVRTRFSWTRSTFLTSPLARAAFRG